uniref:Uncharacterized protein n=1 Tax=Arundo donax TaxID=35708 RepID=A0A0A9HGL7_ARUDO
MISHIFFVCLHNFLLDLLLFIAFKQVCR